MKLEVNGVQYTQFEQATTEIRLDALSNTFSFTAIGTDSNRPPFKVGDSCRVYVNDEIVLTGHIEVIDGSYDAGSHVITYSGRDKTGDFIDSTISSLSDLGTSISLKSIIEKVLNNIGLDIDVIDNAEPNKFNPAEDIAAPEPGENAFAFVEKLARKRQVILTSNSDGNIVIEQTPGETLIHALQNIIGAENNNILSASFSYDTTGRFNLYKMSSGLNLSPLSGSISTKDIVNQNASVIDANIRAGRQLVLVPEGSYSSAENGKRAQWESRIRQARGQLYSAVVQGYTPPDFDDLWKVNTVIGVADDLAGVNAEMMINSITYNLDTSTGRTTTLSLVEQNAYNLQLQEPVTQKVGDGFAF